MNHLMKGKNLYKNLFLNNLEQVKIHLYGHIDTPFWQTTVTHVHQG